MAPAQDRRATGGNKVGFLEKIFGNSSEKELKRIQPLVNEVLSYEEDMQKLTDEELRGKTA